MITKFCFWSQRLQNVPQSNVTCVEMFHDQQPWTVQQRPDFFFHQNFTPVTAASHCIRHQCFISLPNVQVVLKIYFSIHIVARNNVQHGIKQAKGGERFACLHYIRVVMLHIRVICFEHIAAWTRCCDMRKVCGNIFEDRKRCNVQLNLNVHLRFSQIFQLYDIYIGICQTF